MMRKNLALWLSSTALAALAMPAAAQSGLCGGAGDNGQWIGGSEQSSDITSAGNYMEQMALVLMGNEYVALFNVTQPTDVRVEAAGRGGGDPVIDLRDAGGSIILSDDDSGGEGNSLGEIVIQQGDYGEELFIVERGELDVLIDAHDGMQHVATLRKDQFFGEMSLMTGEERKATIRATDEVTLLVVSRETLQPILEASPDLANEISEVLAERELELGERTKGAPRRSREMMTERSGELLNRIRAFFSI